MTRCFPASMTTRVFDYDMRATQNIMRRNELNECKMQQLYVASKLYNKLRYKRSSSSRTARSTANDDTKHGSTTANGVDMIRIVSTPPTTDAATNASAGGVSSCLNQR